MVTTVSLNFIRLLESQTPEKDVWINEPLTTSSDVTTRKPGTDCPNILNYSFTMIKETISLYFHDFLRPVNKQLLKLSDRLPLNQRLTCDAATLNWPLSGISTVFRLIDSEFLVRNKIIGTTVTNHWSKLINAMTFSVPLSLRCSLCFFRFLLFREVPSTSSY